MNRPQILILNKDILTQKSLYELLSRSNYKVEAADTFKKAIEFLKNGNFKAVLADIDKAPGLELLKFIKENSYNTAVIMLSSYGKADSAANAITLGAFDYLIKPIEDQKILSVIRAAIDKMDSLSAAAISSKKGISSKALACGLVGNSAPITEIYSLIDRVSTSKATILLRGESGTGKRMIARAIHKSDKKRKDKPFIEVSCGALPKEIIESELFGHTKGSFTGALADRKGRFELADGGTILLDDIDSFSLDLQTKLLRVLQQKEFERVGDHNTMKVDVRVIATTNQNLEKAIADGRFRQDLYYRLNVISITIPPLRERKEDLPALIKHFIAVYSKENYKKIKNITDEAYRILTSYDWPGNVRELENIIERAVILDTDLVIDKDDLPEVLLSGSSNVVEKPVTLNTGSVSTLKEALKNPERIFIEKILEEVGGNKKKAAIKLGVNRTTLYNKLRQHNLLSYISSKK